jgi:IS5 family transposase
MALLRIPYMQQWFTLSDPAMEEALHDTPLSREFAGLGWDTWLPDESTILRFRHLMEKAQAGRADLGAGQRVAARQGAAAQGRHGGRCHADRRTEFDQDRQRRT